MLPPQKNSNHIWTCCCIERSKRQQDGNYHGERPHQQSVRAWKKAGRDETVQDVMTDSTAGHGDKEVAEWEGAARHGWRKQNWGERNALRRQIGAEKVLTRVLMKRRNAAGAGNRSCVGWRRHIKTPSAKLCLLEKFYEEGFGLRDDGAGNNASTTKVLNLFNWCLGSTRVGRPSYFANYLKMCASNWLALEQNRSVTWGKSPFSASC